MLGVTESLVPEWQSAGHSRQRTGPTLPGIAPSNVYPTRDGQLIIAANQDSVFRRLVEVMDRPELATDERFANHQARGANMAEIDGIFGEWAQQYDSADLQERLNAAGVPAGLVYRPQDMLDDPQFAARGSIATVKDDRRGELAMPAIVPKLSETPGEIRWTGQALGADTDAVLRDLGRTDGQIVALREAGAVR